MIYTAYYLIVTVAVFGVFLLRLLVLLPSLSNDAAVGLGLKQLNTRFWFLQSRHVSTSIINTTCIATC